MIRKVLILSLVLASLIGGMVLVPTFEIRVGSVPTSAKLDVEARDLNLVCPGSLFKAGGTQGTTLGNFEHAGTVSYVDQFNGMGGAELTSNDGVYSVSAPTEVTNQGSSLLNASQFQNAKGPTLRGLAATNCQLPSNDIWLVGGATTTGREALLILRNTSEVDSTVSLEIFSAVGPVKAPGLNGIAVVAGKTTVVPLAGVVAQTKSFVTHVRASGGSVSAWIQQRTVRGLTPGGVDYVSPSPVQSKEQVIPGIFVSGADKAGKIAATKKDYEDLVTVLRIYVPGNVNATVTAQIVGATKSTFGTVVRATVNAGAVSDIEIPELKDGKYVAVISSDVEIQSSIRLSRFTENSGTDFTWIPAAEKFTGARKLTVPSVGTSKLSIYEEKTGAIKLIPVKPGSTYSFEARQDSIYANLITEIDGHIANLSVLDQKYASGTVSVNIR